jgi:TPR repeat protein
MTKNQARNFVNYVATREGVSLNFNSLDLSEAELSRKATIKQEHTIEGLLREVPSAKDTFEYEDYLKNPTIGNASELIARAAEMGFGQMQTEKEVGSEEAKNFVEYVAKRPGAVREGAHGLFSSVLDLDLDKVADEVASYRGRIWRNVVSIRREDADKLGYDTQKPWKAAALHDHVHSEYMLAKMYYDGCGTVQDYAEALRLYQETADRNDKDACYATGRMYLKGIGCPQNEKDAAAYFTKASRENVPYTDFALAQLCETGTGVSKDQAAAHILYQKALDEFLEQEKQQPDAFTEYRIAKMLIQLDAASDGAGESQYAPAAVQWFKKSADNGNASAAFEFARLTERGPEADRQQEITRRYYASALEGFVRAYANAGSLPDRRAALGSEKEYFFNYYGGSNRLYVFEAPIDLMSFLTFKKNADWKRHNFLALGCTASRALIRFLLEHTNITDIGLCLDNDATGQKGDGQILSMLERLKAGKRVDEVKPEDQPKLQRDYRVLVIKSTQKDWNEDLKAAFR